MALAEVLVVEDIPTPLALAPVIESQDASQHDWRLSLGREPRIITNRITPVDPLRGLPLLVAVTGYEELTPNNATEHHGWHPRRRPFFKTLAGAALRASWHPMLPPELHNLGDKAYHPRLKGPKSLPNQEDDIYSRIILACAFEIPPRVIDLSGELPVERDMSAAELEFFNTPDQRAGHRYIRNSQGPIREFFQAYLVDKQGLGKTHYRKANEFLRTNSDEHRRALGHLLLMKSAEVATNEVRVQYSLLQRAALLQPAVSSAPITLVG